MRSSSRIPRRTTLLALVTAACTATEGGTADLILTDGRVVTVDDAQPEAEAVAIRDGRIVAVGSSAAMERYAGADTRIVDLEGRLAIPGFIEGHGHYTSLGQSKLILDLNDVANWDEIVDMVAAAVAEAGPGAWIRGRGWHQEKWDRVPADAVDGVP